MQHNGREVQIIYYDFPEILQGTVKGFLMEDGPRYKIVIDSTRSPQQQRHTLGHELAHLYLNHLDQHGRNVREQEREANAFAWHYYRQYKTGSLGKVHFGSDNNCYANQN